MPLPFAPKPEDSRVYQSLKGEVLNAVTPEQMDSLRSSVFAQGIDGSEDEYRRLILLQMAANIWPSGAPIPNTMKIVTADGGTSASTIVAIYEPAANEVWQVLDVGATRTGSGATNYFVGYWDGVNTTTDDGFVPIVDKFTTSDGQVQFDDWPGSAVFIDSNITVGLNHTSGTVTAMTYKAAIVRIR